MNLEQAGSETSGRAPLLSIATPAYNEEVNLPLLYDRLKEVLDGLQIDWEWVVVDDHSSDATFAVLNELSARDPRVVGIRLARNQGAHIAMTCALHHVRGQCAVILAADLQDPPEVIPLLLEEWRKGPRIVWAAREEREGASAFSLATARIYWWILRRVVGFEDLTAMGADFMLLDRKVVEALHGYAESNITLTSLLTYMGFEQSTITYVKQARSHGQSGWTLKKKLKLLADSVTGFSYAPIRIMSYTGIGLALLGFLYAAVVVVSAILGDPPDGWAALMVVLLLVSGVQMIMMGVLGEYLWRALDEARNRPMYLIEHRADHRAVAPTGGNSGVEPHFEGASVSTSLSFTPDNTANR